MGPLRCCKSNHAFVWLNENLKRELFARFHEKEMAYEIHAIGVPG
jgi:hypothetical protein